MMVTVTVSANTREYLLNVVKSTEGLVRSWTDSACVDKIVLSSEHQSAIDYILYELDKFNNTQYCLSKAIGQGELY